jgi:hypothetical protein
VHGGPAWARRVCSSSPLDARVKLLLAESPCRQHRVCQVLSPTDLQRVASDATCMEEVKTKWWKLFHRVDKILHEFELGFINKFDIDRYSVEFDVDQCKVRQKGREDMLIPVSVFGFKLLLNMHGFKKRVVKSFESTKDWRVICGSCNS